MHEYELRRSRRKTISLEITGDLRVLVRAPLRTPKASIDEFVRKNENWITAHMQKRREYNSAQPPEPGDGEIELLKAAAKKYIPERVKYFSDIMGLYPANIKITSAKTRYGSCSGKNSLCFSFRLMQYPEEAIDLVVVHELAHIKHKNHGTEFYACVASVLPDYKERKKLLTFPISPDPVN